PVSRHASDTTCSPRGTDATTGQRRCASADRRPSTKSCQPGYQATLACTSAPSDRTVLAKDSAFDRRASMRLSAAPASVTSSGSSGEQALGSNVAGAYSSESVVVAALRHQASAWSAFRP